MRLFAVLFLLSFMPALWAQSVQENFQAVNSPLDEQSPVLSPDGQTLFFTITNHPSNMGGKKDPGDIWFTRKEGDAWSTPVHAGRHLNDRAYNAVAGFSENGLQMFLHGHYTGNGTPAKTQGIAVSDNDGAGWSHPRNVTIPYFLNKSGTPCGSLSSDNSVFVFSADSYGTYGVDDIYVCIRRDGKWSEPKNLGSAINTQFQELSPSISDDLKTLYFSSNGRKGQGSFDVYSATRLDDSWTNWSTPENLGTDINTEGRELYYRFYPAQGFALFTSTKSSDGYGDMRVHGPHEPPPVASDTVIYASLERNDEVNDESNTVPQDEIVKVSAPQRAPENNPVGNLVNIHGKITNAKTGATIPARISFESAGLEDQSVAAGEAGYQIGVPSSHYTIRIEANGYISALEKLDINGADMRDLEMNFRLQPVEVGTTVNLKNVLFAQAKTEILPESYPELDLVVAFLKENPKVRIELMGHTDGRGVHADNVKLSQQRVNKVKEYLVSKGIEARRISGKGFGGSKPIASNDTEESRRMNRRVEFVIRKF
ncbi:MAG TPA: OmpA family protein [Chryseosolibacter sp.]|nr:OmpA family protein [Chryseosolibacter sp.]